MVAREDAAHEVAIDRTTIAGAIFRETLLALGKRRTSFAGPDQRVEGESLHALRMPLREQTGAERTQGRTVEQELPATVLLQDVFGGRREVVGAARYVGIHRPGFVRAPITFAVDTPGVVAASCKPIHRRGFGFAGDLQVEHRRRRNRRPMDEKDRSAPTGGIRSFLQPFAPEKEPDV